jgi:hypothetical protein
MSAQAPVIIDFTAPQNAVGATVILPFTDYGTPYEEMSVILSHEGGGGTTPLVLLVEFSFNGSKPNKRLEQSVEVGQGEEGDITFIITAPLSARYIRITVTSDGSTVPFTWSLRGRKR